MDEFSSFWGFSINVIESALVIYFKSLKKYLFFKSGSHFTLQVSTINSVSVRDVHEYSNFHM